MEMVEVNRTGDCKPREGGGQDRTARQTVARSTTRKRAGIIATRETVRHVHRSSGVKFVSLPSLFLYVFSYVFKAYLRVIFRGATCMMGMMGMFKWLRKDFQRDRSRRSLTPNINGLNNNDAYRNALQAFIDRRRTPTGPDSITAPDSPDTARLQYVNKKNYENDKNNAKNKESDGIPGVPNVQASEIFEIGWIAGTEDRHIELIYAEWQSTRVAIRRQTHPDCKGAIKADLEVLNEIRHPNVLLLMATTHTDEHGLVAIFEPVDCTLFNYVHEQGERVSVQGIAKCAGSLACALRHAHMRGYVHGAISSHCVFLAKGGIVKLGGWELSSSVNNAKITPQCQDRLRIEIYKWLAPEIYKGETPSKASDVFGLTLLMWEMSTMNTPWNGLSMQEVEREYVTRGRGVATDQHNFPPLLKNILDAGLRLDISKRTLDMNRMRRFLQTLQIQYEDAELLYVDLISKDNTQQPSTANATPKIDAPSVSRQTSAKVPKISSEKKPETSKKKPECSQKKPESSEKENVRYHLKDQPVIQKRAEPREKFAEIRRENNVQKSSAKIPHKARTNEKVVPKMRKPARKDDLPSRAPPVVDSTDEESFSDSRSNIKKIKEALASRRENFFYGSDSSQFSTPVKIEVTKNRMLTQVRSKDYEPHKPASHKTSLEPKVPKSPGDYNTCVASQCTRHQSPIRSKPKSPYSHVPSVVRDAVVYPKVLNSSSSSFFETSLWKKEKMICLSRMRRNDPNSTYSLSRFPPAVNQSVEKTDSADSNCTYTVKEPKTPKNSAETLESTSVESPNDDLESSPITRSKSLLALKEALERATEIVRSTTPHPSECSTATSSPFKSPRSFDNSPNKTAENESAFEDLYALKHEESDSEMIRTIERSTKCDDSLLLTPLRKESEEVPKDAEEVQEVTEKVPEVEEKVQENSEKNQEVAEKVQEDPEKVDVVLRKRNQYRDNKFGAFEGSRLSSHVCESIAESHNENEDSGASWKPDDSPWTYSGTSSAALARQVAMKVELEEEPEEFESSVTFLISRKKPGCETCSQNNALVRRRSLPAMGQLSNLNNPALGRLPIRKIALPDDRTQDMYIDDEFGGELNSNMQLVGRERIYDEGSEADMFSDGFSDICDYYQ